MGLSAIESKRIPSIDGLRAISILFVVIGHSSSTLPNKDDWFATVWLFLGKSALGVHCFFIISGFLITTLLMNEYDKNDTINMRGFYFRRMLRIFPAFYSFIIVIAMLTWFGILDIPKTTIVSAALYLWNYKQYWDHSGSIGEWFLGHFWTLSVEEQFYLFWPFVILIGRKNTKVGIVVSSVIIVLSPVMRTLSYFLLPESRSYITHMFHTTADVLMFGCFGALVWKHKNFQQLLDVLDRTGAPILALVILFIISPILEERYHGAYVLPFGMTVNSLCILIVVLWSIRHSTGMIGKMLNSPIPVHIGVISYSLYLWQQLFLTPFNRTWSGTFPLNLVCAFAVAEFSYFIIERPFLRLRHLMHRPAAAKTVVKSSI